MVENLTKLNITGTEPHKTSPFKSTVDLLNNLIRQVEKQIQEMPALPSKETTEKINRLISLKDFLVVEQDKWIYENT